MENVLILKGNILYSENKDTIVCKANSYLVSKDGVVAGVFEKLPAEYAACPVTDYGDKLILPGMVDMHIHAPQFSFRGNGMDLELLPWLNTYTFPEEAKFENLDYAKKAYGYFADRMKKSATTRAVIFATRHREATLLLMDLMEQTGLDTFIGKINMDRESIPELMDKGPLDSAYSTFGWINEAMKRFKLSKPILTPRFIPSCSDALMNELNEIQRTYHIPVQSHLSENPGEVAWVSELCPWSKFYGDAYDHFGLFGSEGKTVMAHCIFSGEDEIALMKKNGVFVAHCPASNMNLSSGIAPIRRYLDENMNVGIGSDVAGGESESMFRAIVQTIQVSKMYWRYIDETKKPLTFDEAFYLATLGGGQFFGKVGSFKEGYAMDAVVIDDSIYPSPIDMTIKQRIERAVYLSTDINGIVGKFVNGSKVL